MHSKMRNSSYWVAIGSLFLAACCSSLCFSAELSLNGIVPAVSEADGCGSTMGFPVGGYMPGDDVELYAGYWGPVIPSPGPSPHIETNALIFPSRNAVLLTPFPTNISWYVDKITSDTDGTNVTVSEIAVYLADSTNEVAVVTNSVPNVAGAISWSIPEELIDGRTNYVLRFEVVDGTSSTNSRIFWDNPFAVVIPEPVAMSWMVGLLAFLWRKR